MGHVVGLITILSLATGPLNVVEAQRPAVVGSVSMAVSYVRDSLNLEQISITGWRDAASVARNAAGEISAQLDLQADHVRCSAETSFCQMADGVDGTFVLLRVPQIQDDTALVMLGAHWKELTDEGEQRVWSAFFYVSLSRVRDTLAEWSVTEVMIGRP
jgi:hypothetical protein